MLGHLPPTFENELPCHCSVQQSESYIFTASTDSDSACPHGLTQLLDAKGQFGTETPEPVIQQLIVYLLHTDKRHPIFQESRKIFSFEVRQKE